MEYYAFSYALNAKKSRPQRRGAKIVIYRDLKLKFEI
jgi:hypothetical protein